MHSNGYFSKTINITEESTMKRADEAWKNLNELRGVTAQQFFKLTFGFDFDKDSQNHNQHLENLESFLHEKVGDCAYVDEHIFSPQVTVVKNASIKNLNPFERMFHVWNLNVGSKLLVTQFTDLISRIFNRPVGRADSTLFMNLVCEMDDLASVERMNVKGRPNLYTIKSKLPRDYFEVIVEEFRKIQKKTRDNWRKKSGKVTVSEVKKLKEAEKFSVFRDHNFITVNGQVIVQISEAEAKNINELFFKRVLKIRSLKKTNAELIDNLQVCSTTIKILEQSKVTSVSDALNELKDME